MIDDPVLGAWLAGTRQSIEAALERFLPSPPDAPAIVCDAMRYSLLAGGKRVRPLLALAAADATAAAAGAAGAAAVALALPCACAIEYIHTYSLVHDDLPAMDNDTLRRGRPTAHVVYGDGQAILAGDGLLTEAFRLMAQEPAHAPGLEPAELGRRKLQVIGIVAQAAGASGMVGGQALDLRAAEPGAPPFDADALRAMHARKTGALIRGSALSGAVMAGADGTYLVAIDEYATSLGLAFQIIDDILDVEGASANLGKTAGKDALAGKPTYPAIYGLDRSHQLARDCVARALSALEKGGLGGHLPGIARWVAGRTN